MNELNEGGMRTHVPVVAWLLILSGALFLALAVFLFILLAGIGIAVNDAQAQTVLTVVGLSMGVLFGLLSLPGMVAGVGLLWRKNWGRVLAIVVSVLNLLNFPIGTLIGGYALYILFQESAEPYFGGSATASQ